MTTAKHQVSPRRHAAPAARQSKRPAPVLVAGMESVAPVPPHPGADLPALWGCFSETHSLAQAIAALLRALPPDDQVYAGLDLAHKVASIADKARDRTDRVQAGEVGPEGFAWWLQSLATQADALSALCRATADMLEASPSLEESAPIHHALDLLDMARERAELAVATARRRAPSEDSLSSRIAA